MLPDKIKSNSKVKSGNCNKAGFDHILLGIKWIEGYTHLLIFKKFFILHAVFRVVNEKSANPTRLLEHIRASPSIRDLRVDNNKSLTTVWNSGNLFSTINRLEP